MRLDSKMAPFIAENGCMGNGKEMGSSFGKMGSVTKENGKKIVHLAKESWSTVSMSTMKEILWRIAGMGLEFTCILGLFTVDSGKMISNKAAVYKNGALMSIMKENGKADKKMERERSTSKTEASIREISLGMRSMALDIMNGRIWRLMRDNGNTTEWMERESSSMQMEISMKAT